MLNAVGLTGGLPNEVSAAEAHVAPQTPLHSSGMGATVESSMTVFDEPPASPVTANVLATVHSPRDSQSPQPRSAATDLTHSKGHGVGKVVSQDPPRNIHARVREPVKNAVPAIAKEEPVGDVTPLPDADVGAPDDGTTLPPDLADPDLRPLPVDLGGDEPPTADQHGPSTGNEGSASNPSTLPNDPGAQDSPNVVVGDSTAPGSASPRQPFLPLQVEFSAVGVSHTFELADLDLTAGRQTGLQPMAGSAALDAAIVELFGAEEQEEENENFTDQAETVDEATTNAPAEETANIELAEENADSVALGMLRLADELAPMASQTLLPMAIGVAAGDAAPALKALDDLLGAVDELGEESGLWTQVGFAICLLATVAAAGGGYEITRRQLKRDRQRVRGEVEDEDNALPPDMLPMASLS